MFKFYINNKKMCLYKYNNYYISDKKFFYFITFNITGRIFKWTNNFYYNKFLLPMHNKPHLFIKNVYFIKKNLPTYLFFDVQLKNYTNYLLNLKNTSLYYKRGYFIYNRIIYKKKGKTSSYITNK